MTKLERLFKDIEVFDREVDEYGLSVTYRYSKRSLVEVGRYDFVGRITLLVPPNIKVKSLYELLERKYHESLNQKQ